MSAAAEVEQFILEELMAGSAVVAIDHDEDLLGTGVIDSHGLLQLVTLLRERYGIEVSEEALTPENFQTIAAIDAFVQRERGSA
ncbi:MAG TPA: phosphopantetheine-binding protein [Conexibacter sp.]|nr:phosphopantetheine-binding protein [Conexibacter sp.]